MAFDVFTPQQGVPDGYATPPPAPATPETTPDAPDTPAAFLAPSPDPAPAALATLAPPAVAALAPDLLAPAGSARAGWGKHPFLVRPMPSGYSITITDPRDLTRIDRRDLLTLVRTSDDVTLANAHLHGYEFVNAVLRMLVVEWTYPGPIPSVDPSGLDLIPSEDEDELAEVSLEVQRLLFPPRVSPDDADDPTSPSEPSDASP